MTHEQWKERAEKWEEDCEAWSYDSDLSGYTYTQSDLVRAYLAGASEAARHLKLADSVEDFDLSVKCLESLT